ncbi:putative serine/threonine-protein kinase GCN2 [Platanthera guangdongensis]|uniref:Serine/threonine-protein kinase GCN2 n=1 Tax=Platanthera guangdongensis TaxID=2320717 RepID=A0ABR2MRA6_9ASPA
MGIPKRVVDAVSQTSVILYQVPKGTTDTQLSCTFVGKTIWGPSWEIPVTAVDMYSLGVVFFELWNPFRTVMERHIILSDLKQKRLLPDSWIKKFPKQSAILQRLISPSPADRPPTSDLVHQDLLPRMEDE